MNWGGLVVGTDRGMTSAAYCVLMLCGGACRGCKGCRGCKAGRGAGGQGVGGENESCHGVYADVFCRCGAASLGLLPSCGVSCCGLDGDGVLAMATAGVRTSMTGLTESWP